MHLLRCTKKLLTEMKLNDTDLYQEESSSSGLGDWYVNLFKYSRFKCLVFTNEMTLFSFVSFRVGKSEIRELPGEFRYHLNIALKQEGIPDKIIFSILEDYLDVKYGKTTNRSVLGSMNDMISIYKFRVDKLDTLNPDTLQSLNVKLNRNPLKVLDYKYPIEKLKKLLEFRYQ